ncbi:hypothetical protein GT022_11395 [Agaribacter marinus]|uniref:Uncharacterized protein n=1 Tax=Virgibacillus salarius TaxID=447199 RepID=A0A941DWB4_9BACI|nr:hypothetical protein [Virgibacillus salarius]MBR7796646.1 hypothetical protein [Virgibacillus salarius]NAZ09356.1 hypothetical protein [Agaribacter marinus]
MAKTHLYLFHSITKKSSGNEWRKLALYDDLTGLANKRSLDRALQQF